MDKIAKYICFDCESTGLDSNINNILTISFIVLNKNLDEIDRLNLSIKHDSYNIIVKAMEVNKIDLIKHHNESIDIITAKNTLINFLKKNKNAYNLIPICHNCNHDISFIKNSGLLSKEQYNNYFSYNSIDTIVIAQFLKMSGKLPEKQSISLSSLIEYLGISNKTNSKFHTAEYDTEMTIELLKKFRELEKLQILENFKKRKMN
jgi:DNA polymerase III alpha subunit (gram-positive type)